MNDAPTPPDFEPVLARWFGEPADTPEYLAERQSLWFGKDPSVDSELARRFGPLLAQGARGGLDRWIERGPRGTLALIVLLDQFPRNIHRGTPRAFAQDDRALAVAIEAVEAGLDRGLRFAERVFVYLPFEHAEDLRMQERSVALFERLAREAPAAIRPWTDMTVEYAVRHEAVIRRFGRFPHRNVLLGRASTPEEQAFLREPGSHF